MTIAESLLAIAGLAAITLLTRGLFLLPERELPVPEWLRQGLRHAPLAALTAVVVPEIVLTNGQLISTWQDPRPIAAAVAGAWYFWRRGLLGTIVAGMVALFGLRFGAGW